MSLPGMPFLMTSKSRWSPSRWMLRAVTRFGPRPPSPVTPWEPVEFATLLDGLRVADIRACSGLARFEVGVRVLGR